MICLECRNQNHDKCTRCTCQHNPAGDDRVITQDKAFMRSLISLIKRVEANTDSQI